jgi:hypothetical protein
MGLDAWPKATSERLANMPYIRKIFLQMHQDPEAQPLLAEGR